MRCAVYTRKSVDEAQDAQFGSNEAQHGMCVKFIESQAGDGWIVSPERFDDIGWSGGNLDRPALMQLRALVAARKVDVVVVYKVDRLSRSLKDFLNLMAEFEARGVSFVSVTQSFNTTTSVGRLTLNILLSFGQFERELIGERLRDWFAGARGRGLWTSPKRPYGYDIVDQHLTVNKTEAKAVRFAFLNYSRVGSAAAMAKALNRKGLTNTMGRPWLAQAVRLMLHNPVYLGHMTYRGQPLPGTHAPIVTQAEWDAAARAMQSRSALALAAPDRPRPPRGLLHGRLFDSHGYKATHVTHRRGGRYYETSRRAPVGQRRFRAAEMEECVRRALAMITGGLRDDQQLLALLGGILIRQKDLQITLTTGAILHAAIAGEIVTSGVKARKMVSSGSFDLF